MRQAFEFVGSKNVSVSLDPDEYKGLPVPRITEEIKRVLRSIDPAVDFVEADVTAAAEAIHGKFDTTDVGA